MSGLAQCRVTQMALLRLATNAAVMGADVMKPAAAWKMLDQAGRRGICSGAGQY
jgi:hypothetical protein